MMNTPKNDTVLPIEIADLCQANFDAGYRQGRKEAVAAVLRVLTKAQESEEKFGDSARIASVLQTVVDALRPLGGA